ncbi:hypothetical protein BH09PLA1_BH09PLA1_08090 [soil metagenome]
MTLIEVSVALAMFSIIAVALGSALTIAVKAVPDAKSANPSLLAASAVHDQIAAELFYALSVSEQTANAITFTVRDRDNDGVDETIRYAWSGVAGAPLTKQLNAGAAAPVLADVREFALTFDKRSVKSPTTYTEGPEQLIYSSGKGLLGAGVKVRSNSFPGESLPTVNWSGSVVLWRVTRVRFTSQHDVSGSFRVQVRTQDASGLPSSVVVDQATVASTALPASWGSVDATFSNPPSMLPSDTACIVFRWLNGGSATDGPGELWTNTLTLSLLGGSKYVVSTNGGTSWGGNALKALAMSVWAAPSTKNADTYQYYLTNVRCVMRSGSDAAGRVVGSSRLPTEPQVTGP